jgi:hypothetical protein
MLGEGIVPRVDAITTRSFPNPPYREPDMPFRHPDSGQFVSPPHPEDASRDLRGRFR